MCSHFAPDTPLGKECHLMLDAYMNYNIKPRYAPQNYYYDKRNTPWPCHRSHTEVLNAKPLGKLVYHSGKLKIKKKIKAIFVRYGVWTDFNAKFKPG